MTELLIVNGMMRSGTIWLSRLLADSLGCACRIHVPSTTEQDSAVWGLDRPGPFIRRVHYYPDEYPYGTVPQVLIVRDPRDTAVSQATFYNRTMEQAVRWLIPRWNRFYKAWYEHELTTSIVRYEDLASDPVETIEWMLLEISHLVELDAIERAVHDNEFSRMVNYHKGKYGHAGAYKTAMSNELAERMAAKCHEVMELYGYE